MSSILGNLAVGKQRVVGRIDEARIGPRPRDLAEDRQAAEAGIEHQDSGERMMRGVTDGPTRTERSVAR